MAGEDKAQELAKELYSKVIEHADDESQIPERLIWNVVDEYFAMFGNKSKIVIDDVVRELTAILEDKGYFVL